MTKKMTSNSKPLSPVAKATAVRQDAQQATPMRCFQGNAQPFEPFWRWVNLDGGDVPPTLEIDGVLSEFSWFEDDITPQKFKDDLYTFGQGGPVLLKINSPGGDVFAASRMRTIMTEYPGEITVRVQGLAASAAVMVAISGVKTQMTDTSYMMIHDPAIVVLMAQLDIETLGKLRDDLRSIKDGIVPAYAAKTGMNEDKIARMMSNETWMSAREALDYGFIDEILTGGQGEPKSQEPDRAYVNVLQSYENVPPGLLTFTSEAKPTEADVEREGAILRLRERIQSFKEKTNG